MTDQGKLCRLSAARFSLVPSKGMLRARMKYDRDRGITIEGYPLAEGLRAGFFDGRERFAKPISE